MGVVGVMVRAGGRSRSRTVAWGKAVNREIQKRIARLRRMRLQRALEDNPKFLAGKRGRTEV